jgi:hypothetical protein
MDSPKNCQAHTISADAVHRHSTERERLLAVCNPLWAQCRRDFNRGERGKSARVPHLNYLERLHKRNTFLIESHHPLRETLIAQTGATELSRQRFLQQHYDKAKLLLNHQWSPREEQEIAF